MKINRLGRSDIRVPDLCLGTMTYGTQTDPEDAFAQMDMAMDAGINFFDVAEMYPVTPVSAETQGRSEEIIGDWFTKTGRRDQVVLATKHTGKGLKHVRGGNGISAQSIPQAVEGSLKRLKTDVIDLYQLHWPNRGSYHFRQNWNYNPATQDTARTQNDIGEILHALDQEIKRGTIRTVGLSNETSWGTSQFLKAAEAGQGPRMVSIQNEYSLMCRLFDTDLAELSHYEDVGLLAYSPLATGFLTGKYRDGAVPAGSRRSIHADLGGRNVTRAHTVADAYVDLAAKHDLDPVHMALMWCTTRPFMTSTIFGATTLDQLRHIIAGMDVTLSDEVMRDINALHRAHPMPF